MAGLPHFTNLSNSASPGGPGSGFPSEILLTNLFEITMIFPVILQAQGRDPLLILENATKVSFANLTNFDISVKEQRYKYSTRAFLTTPTKTHGELEIPIQIAMNEFGAIENWNTLKAWYDLAFNSQNGELHYKADMVGTIIVNQHDRKGVVIRRVTFQNCQLYKLAGYELDWSGSDMIGPLPATFVYDYFIDEYIDSGFTITPPLLSGY